MTPEQYFNRQIQLWGEATQKSLQNKKIAIIGSGGLGSTLAMALGTSGIGEIHMVDFDTVSNHNIHRQIAFTLQDEGKNKAKTVAALIESKNPFVKARAFDMAFDTFKELGNTYDLILDATDNLPVRSVSLKSMFDNTLVLYYPVIVSKRALEATFDTIIL